MATWKGLFSSLIVQIVTHLSMDFTPPLFTRNMVNEYFIILYDKIGLNLIFERAFVFVLGNTLGPSAVTHYNRNTPTNYQLESQVSR